MKKIVWVLTGLAWMVLACSCIGNANAKTRTTRSVKSTINPALPRILHVNIADQMCGGVAEIVFSLSKKLIEKSYYVKVVASRGSHFHQELKKRGIPCIDVDVHWPKKGNADLAKELEEICRREAIDIINVHKPWDYDAARRVAKKLGIGSVAFYHSYAMPKPRCFSGFDAVFSVNPQIIAHLQQEKGGAKYVELMNPPFDEGRLLNFKTQRDRKTFFMDVFGIAIKDCPLICMVANLYPCKNHSLLLRAASLLINREHVPVQIALVGADSTGEKAMLLELVRNLKLQDYVYFLGYTKEVPELLFHADLAVLPSKFEAFGIVVLEAALMKKPLIVSKNCGVAGCFIEHGVNGLIIDPESEQDLARAIKMIVTDLPLARALGQCAFERMLMDFSTEAAVAKVENVYRVISDK
jgi:glycosyltransferase involved in cell wall biosynthesis